MKTMSRSESKPKAASGEQTDSERRRHRRRSIRGMVDYRFRLPSGRVYGSGRSVDVSRGGLGFRCRNYIPAGTVIEFSVALNGRRLEGRARVAQCWQIPGQPIFHCGIRFIQLVR